MKRASFREGVAWIALNDSAADQASVEDIAGWVSTLLLADLFQVEPLRVAKAVQRLRQKAG